MEEIDDRRGSGRVNIMIPVVLEYDGRRTEATALDVSDSGISVWQSEAAPDGPVRIGFALDGNDALALVGRVVRTFESDGGSVWGIAFENLDHDSRIKLQQYVATRGP